MTPVASPVSERYPRGSKRGGVLRQGGVWVLLGLVGKIRWVSTALHAW